MNLAPISRSIFDARGERQLRKYTVLSTALLMLVVLVLSSTHVLAQIGIGGISIPIIGETTGKAIEGNPQMVITASVETMEGVTPIKYDTIPAVSPGSRIRLEVTLLNMAVRPEADATLGVVVGVSGDISREEYVGRSMAEKNYEQMSRAELRKPQLGCVSFPGRWITAIRTGRVQFAKQRDGQNGLLSFVAYIEPRDLKPGTNTFIVRVHGILETRSTRFLILGKTGKQIFGTYDEPLLINVAGYPDCDPPKDRTGLTGPTNGDGGTGPTAEVVPPPTAAPVKIQIDARGVVTFDRIPPPDCRVLYNIYSHNNGSWREWKMVVLQSREVSFNLNRLVPGTYILAIQVVGPDSQMLGGAQRTLTVGGR